jgi:hypothetical protein
MTDAHPASIEKAYQGHSTQRPAWARHMRYSLQAFDCWQSPSLTGWHTPPRALQLPKVLQPYELEQVASSATHMPPWTTHRPASRQSTDWAHSPLDPATHLPPLIEQSPRRLQSGLSPQAL